MTTPDWMYNTLLGNSLRDWTLAIGGALIASVAIVMLRNFVVRRLAGLAARTDTLVDDALVELVRSVRKTFVFVVALCLAGLWLDFSYRVHTLLRDVAVVLAVLQGARSGTRLVTLWLDGYSNRRGASSSHRARA